MSETTEQTAPEATEAEGQQEQQDTTPELGDAGKKAIQAEREARKAAEKAAAEYRAKLQEIEDANLSEVERAKREAEQTSQELAALRSENLRNKVALEKGLPVDLIGFLTGDTEEDVAAKADLLLSRISAPTTPKPDRSQGASGKGAPLSTAQQFAQQLGDF